MVPLPFIALPSCEGAGHIWGGCPLIPLPRSKLYAWFFFPYIQLRTRGWSDFSLTFYFSGALLCVEGKHGLQTSFLRPSSQSWLAFLGNWVKCHSSLPCDIFPFREFSSHLQDIASFTSALLHYLLHLWTQGTCSITTIATALIHTRQYCVYKTKHGTFQKKKCKRRLRSGIAWGTCGFWYLFYNENKAAERFQAE